MILLGIVSYRRFIMAFCVMFLILFICYVIQNDRLDDSIRTISFGLIALIVILYILFGIILN